MWTVNTSLLEFYRSPHFTAAYKNPTTNTQINYNILVNCIHSQQARTLIKILCT